MLILGMILLLVLNLFYSFDSFPSSYAGTYQTVGLTVNLLGSIYNMIDGWAIMRTVLWQFFVLNLLQMMSCEFLPWA